MCGLFGGYSSFLSITERENVKALGVLSQFRGEHSAGVVVSSKKFNEKNRMIRIRKCLGSTSHLFADKEFKSITDGHDVQFIIGHARFATSGSVTTANAHPFKCDNIYGVHNGTINNFVVPKEQQEFNSDSRILFNKIREVGVDNALKQAGDGAYAIVYYDLATDTINFARNDKRTLYYVETGGTLYWASEKRFLNFVFEKSSINSSISIRPFLPNRLYTLKVGRNPSSMTSREIVTQEEKEVPAVIKVTAEATFSEKGKGEKVPFKEDNGNLSSRGVDISASNVIHIKPIASKTIQLKGNAVITREDKKRMKNNLLFYRGYNNKLLTLSEVTNNLSKGCVFTGMRATVRDKVYWISPTEYMLKSFYDTNSSLELMFSDDKPIFEGELFTRKPKEVSCH